MEFLLCGVTFPLQQDLLDDPNVWIADSAAPVHSTPHSISLTNVKEAKGVMPSLWEMEVQSRQIRLLILKV